MWSDVEGDAKAIAQRVATSTLDGQAFVAVNVETWVNNITEACLNELKGLGAEKGQFKWIGEWDVLHRLPASSRGT